MPPGIGKIVYCLRHVGSTRRCVDFNHLLTAVGLARWDETGFCSLSNGMVVRCGQERRNLQRSIKQYSTRTKALCHADVLRERWCGRRARKKRRHSNARNTHTTNGLWNGRLNTLLRDSQHEDQPDHEHYRIFLSCSGEFRNFPTKYYADCSYYIVKLTSKNKIRQIFVVTELRPLWLIYHKYLITPESTSLLSILPA